MMRALLFGLPGPQLFNHSEGPELGAMLTPLVRTVKKKERKKKSLLCAEGRCQTAFRGIGVNSRECKR